jgi:hypothetical protein
VRRRAALLTIAALWLCACQTAPPTPGYRVPGTRLRVGWGAATPRRVAGGATARPTLRPTATPYPSGGLGLFRDEWEGHHGRGRGPGPLFGYGGGKLGAAFANDLLWYLERSWGAAEMVPVEAARDESRAYIPGDAELIRTYQTRVGRRVDLYTSSSLRERFRLAAEHGEPIDPWLGAEPGTFIVYYHERGDRVTALVMSTGNNP